MTAKKKNTKGVSKKAAPKNGSTSANADTYPLEVIHAQLQGRDVEGSHTTLDTLYIVNDSTNSVTLEVTVGDKGETSLMSIKLGDSVIANELEGSFPQTVLGTNKALDGKKLSLIATVADTSQETNFTSLTIRVKGGFSAEDFKLFKTVEEEGKSVDYLCLIEFFKP